MNQPQPRRISRTIRYGVSAVLTVLILPFLGFFGPRGDGGENGVMVAIGAFAVGIVMVALLAGNVGFRPRVQGQSWRWPPCSGGSPRLIAGWVLPA